MFWKIKLDSHSVAAVCGAKAYSSNRRGYVRLYVIIESKPASRVDWQSALQKLISSSAEIQLTFLFGKKLAEIFCKRSHSLPQPCEVKVGCLQYVLEAFSWFKEVIVLPTEPSELVRLAFGLEGVSQAKPNQPTLIWANFCLVLDPVEP